MFGTVSESARILIRGLLKTNPAHRLGAVHRPKGKKGSNAEPVVSFVDS